MPETDRQIIERLLIPALMQCLVEVMQRSLGQDAGILNPARDLLKESLREPILSLPDDRLQKLTRRAKRATLQAISLIDAQPIGFQFLTIARLTMRLAERDAIVVGAESSFARAWDMIAAITEAAWDHLSQRDEQATAAAVMIERKLGEMGLFLA